MAPTMAERTGTASREPPGSSANRNPVMAGAGNPAEPTARPTTEGRSACRRRRPTRSGAMRSASPNATADMITTRARHPRPSTVQSHPKT